MGPSAAAGAIYYHNARPLTAPDSLSLEQCTFRQNTSDGYGGALVLLPPAAVAATIDGCLFDSNTAESRGGGFSAQGSSTSIVLTDSTFVGNHGSEGGGAVIDQGAHLSVTNCTFSANTASSEFAGSGAGGGIYSNSASLTVTNGTFAGNYAGFGKSICNGSASALTLRNTLFKKDNSGENITNAANSGATITSLGGNLSNDAAGGNSSTGPGGLLNGPGDLRNTDPKIDVLADNGGPTATHALLSGSPAIDHGTGSEPDRDQRGFLRNTPLDTGAFETNPKFVRGGETLRDGANIVVQFEAVRGYSYVLQRKLQLTDGSWQSVPGVNSIIPDSDGTYAFSVPMSSAKAFYHVVWYSSN